MPKLKSKAPSIPLYDAIAWRKEALKQRKALEAFTIYVGQALEALDNTMHGPVSNDRGRKIAAICNELEMHKDLVRLTYLGISPSKNACQEK